MNQTDTLHLHDTELEALCRRGYQGGHPIELLSDAYLYEENGTYFHTVDGRMAKVWRISGADASVLDNNTLYGVASLFEDALNKYPEASSGQFIRHTHRDIRPQMTAYQQELREDLDEFSKAISDSIIERQYGAAISTSGFFAKLSDQVIDKMRSDAISEMGEVEEDVRANVSKSVQAELREGKYPFVTDLYLIIYWEPDYLFGKLLTNSFKTALAAVGLIDGNKAAYEAYNQQALRFGEICNEISQALATNNFSPEELTGQGLLNLQYQLMNPVRSYRVEPPVYRADRSIYECLQNPASASNTQAINSASAFSYVQTTKTGWIIHDSGKQYHIRAVSSVGKAQSSFPGILQQQMTGIESESLLTLNFHVPKQAFSKARLIGRGQLLKSKQRIGLGDSETLASQMNDLQSVMGALSSENITNKQIEFEVSIHVALMGFDEKHLEGLAAKLENRLGRTGYVERLRGDAVVRSAMPLNYNPKSKALLRRDTPHLTQSLSHHCPLFIEYQGVADPAVVMNNRSGQPVFIDLFGSNVNTGHSIICGATGSGKSFTFNNLLMGIQVKYRPKVWIIDKGDSYESLCLVQGGNYVRLATQPFQEPASGRMVYPICINPYWIAKDENGINMMPSSDDLVFIADVMVMMMTIGTGADAKALHPKTKGLLYKALDDFYQLWVEARPNDEPIMSDFIATLKETNYTDLKGEDLCERLSLYYGSGPYAALTDGKLQVDWENDFTVLETQRMAKSDALPIITLALFRQIEMYCKYKLSKSRKKLIAVDEAWATLSSPAAAAQLAAFYREMRKYNAGCLLISQTVADFVNVIKAETSETNNSQDGILENTSHYFFLACSESDYRLAESELSFSPEEVDLWRSLASLPPIYSEIFYRIRTKQNIYYSGVVRLFASSVCLWIATSHPDDFAVREALAHELMTEHGYGETEARQKAIVSLSKKFPYGARYHVEAA